MKKIFKCFLLALLSSRAKPVVGSAKKIIAVSGSIGKTTAKEAVAFLLKDGHDLLVAPEGFNTPIGVALTLLGETESGFSSLSKWLRILSRAWSKRRAFPEILLLEYGVDRPGDMDELLRIAQPDYGVVTNIAPVHLGPGQFRSIEEIATEKMKLAAGVRAGGASLLNFENELIRERASTLPEKVISYGQTPGNSFQIENLRADSSGISFQVRHQAETGQFFLPVYGTYHALSVLPGIILAREFGIDFEKSAAKLRNFQLPPGRGRIVKGVNGSIIWDSSYNSSPVATKAALRTLAEIPAQRRLALLGNMNELGKYAEKFHEELGQDAATYADELFFVGTEFAAVQRGAGEKKVRLFSEAAEAGKYLRGILESGDVILVKGSQNDVFLERAIREMLADPTDARLLCRQGAEWQEK